MSAVPMDEPLVETELADSEPPRRSGPWKLIAIVALLTLVGVWLVPADKPDTKPVAGQSSSDAPSLLSPGQAQVESSAPAAGIAETADQAADNRPGSRARALIAQMRAAGRIDLDQAYAAAQRAQADGGLADAYLLYFFAAREGHAGSALALGQQADPGSRDPANSVFESADLTQAHKWYQMAAQNGSAEGRERLADLRSRVEQMAAAGDQQAQRISLLWQ